MARSAMLYLAATLFLAVSFAESPDEALPGVLDLSESHLYNGGVAACPARNLPYQPRDSSQDQELAWCMF